jgi:hypothetical protein
MRAALFFLFFSNCVGYGLEMPADGGGKTKSIAPTLTEEINSAFKTADRRKILDDFLPVENIWRNINYNGFDYEAFYYAACPLAGRVATGSWMACEYEDAEITRIFYISAEPKKVTVEIKKIGRKTALENINIAALWEITGNQEDFTVKKLEKIETAEWGNFYNKISAHYIKTGGTIAADGESTLPLSGYYSFYTEKLSYDFCNTVPSGTINIFGSNSAELQFPAGGCDVCIPAKVGGYEGRYAYCGLWMLRNLFDYLIPFL